MGGARIPTLPPREGDATHDAIEDLFREHGAQLVRLARMFADDRDSAEDLVQEAFIRFDRARRRLREPAAAAGYLRATVLNLARDHNRRGLVAMRHLDAHPMGSAGPAPDTALELDEDQQEALAAVRDLPRRQRDCVVLRYFLELPYDEIAATLGIGVNSVKSHLRRGMTALRDRMGGLT